MLFAEIFYSTFWISMISIIWFYTDVVLHYSQLLGIGLEMRLDYLSFIAQHPDKYFPNYLYEKSLECSCNILKFLAKLVSCELCFLVWLSIIAAAIVNNLTLMAPIYVLSLAIILQIRRML